MEEPRKPSFTAEQVDKRNNPCYHNLMDYVYQPQGKEVRVGPSIVYAFLQNWQAGGFDNFEKALCALSLSLAEQLDRACQQLAYERSQLKPGDIIKTWQG